MYTFSLCSSASNRIIGAKDHASIQINIAEVRACIIGIHVFHSKPSVMDINNVLDLPRVNLHNSVGRKHLPHFELI